MTFDQEAALWIDQTRALDAALGLSNIDRLRVLSLLAESSPVELLAAIEKAGQ